MKTWSKRNLAVLIAVLGLLIGGAAGFHSPVRAAGNPNPGVVPNKGHRYGELAADWWRWALSFPVADVPFFNTGGPVDMSAHQSGNVWFLAGANYGLTSPRSGVVPAGKSLFLAMANYLNDYPCPAAFGFEPLPGESLHDFLSQIGRAHV